VIYWSSLRPATFSISIMRCNFQSSWTLSSWKNIQDDLHLCRLFFGMIYSLLWPIWDAQSGAFLGEAVHRRFFRPCLIILSALFFLFCRGFWNEAFSFSFFLPLVITWGRGLPCPGVEVFGRWPWIDYTSIDWLLLINISSYIIIHLNLLINTKIYFNIILTSIWH